MSYVSGDGKPRRQIVIFLIGALIVFASVYVAIDVSSTFNLPFLSYFRFGVLVGLLIQIFALLKMIVYDRLYLISLVMAIIAFLVIGAYLSVTVLHEIGLIPFMFEGTSYSIINLIDTVAESIMMIFFIIATEHLAEQSYHGTPKLPKVLVIVYIILLLFEVFIFIGQLIGFTITIEWVAILLFRIQNISSIIKIVGTLIFVILSLKNIKD